MHLCTLKEGKEEEVAFSRDNHGTEFCQSGTIAKSILSILHLSTVYISVESDVPLPRRLSKYVIAKGELPAIKYELLQERIIVKIGYEQILFGG